MVGTPVYQVGFTSSIQPKNFSALKPGVQDTWPPAESGARMPAIRPWMWNSGMMLRPRSSAVKASAVRMLRAEAQTLPCVSGTIFGREVVPEVCSTSAMSSVSARPPRAGSPVAASAKCSVKLPAPSSGVGRRRATDTPSFSATATAGESEPSTTSRSLAPRSLM